MGIDVSAYKQIKKIECHFDADGEPIRSDTGEPIDWDDWVQFYKNPHFPGRADDIEDKAVYQYEDVDGFLSASYGYYNRMRDRLAEIAGCPLEQYEQYGRIKESHCIACWNGAKGPFSELINFSDCEGVIGARVSAKLAKDFSDFQDKADASNDAQFLQFYNSMKAAFETASDNGAVQFA